MEGESEKNKGSKSGIINSDKFTRKNIITASIILLIAIIGGIFVLRWYIFGLTHVYTEDAEVDGHIVSVSAQVPGNISAIYVRKNEEVSKGQLIAKIDDSTYYPEMLRAKANYNLAKAKLFSAGGNIAQFIGGANNSYYLSGLAFKKAAAELKQAKLSYILAKKNYSRGVKLLGKQFITRQNFDILKTRYLIAKQNYLAALSSFRSASRNYTQSRYVKGVIYPNKLTTLKPLINAVKVAKANYQVALANYKNTFIHSPINGIISEKMSYIGEFINPGTPVVMENNPKKIWVTANVKETVVANIKKGDHVQIKVDSFPGKDFKGTVEFVGSVSTSEFALIPTNNPSGTFTKVTHRLPVRIKVLNNKNHLLKPGMMVEVTINTADHSGKNQSSRS